MLIPNYKNTAACKKIEAAEVFLMRCWKKFIPPRLRRWGKQQRSCRS